jgi:hypothetical protein
MKRIHAIALLAVTLLAANLSVQAQERVVANVPFSFTVGEKLLPAGEYIFSSPEPGIVQIRSVDHRLFAEVTSSHSSHEAGAHIQLVFNRYGSEYFLHRILNPSTGRLNLDIGSSTSERRARARREEAKLAPPESVLVAAR